MLMANIPVSNERLDSEVRSIKTTAQLYIEMRRRFANNQARAGDYRVSARIHDRRKDEWVVVLTIWLQQVHGINVHLVWR